MSLTFRESKYVAARIAGKTEHDAMLEAGFSKWMARVPSQFQNIVEMRSEVERLQAELVQHTLDTGLIDAAEIHEYLTDALRARISDIRRDDGSFIATSEWPEIWQRMYEAGDVEIETLTERSDDGATKDRRGGWDEIGTVTKVKLKFASRVKLLELAMKHKGVNAMVQEKAGDVHVHLHAEVTAKLQAALHRKENLIEA